MKKIFLSIIIPAYREAKRIRSTLVSLDQYFKNKYYSYEIIVVNDGSPDNLAEVVLHLMPRIKNLRLINNTVNSGKGHAVKCGMLEAHGAYRLFMDADNSVSITNLDRFMNEVEEGADVVIGSIEVGNEKKIEHNGFYRTALSRLSKLPVRILATPGIYDTQRGFKLFSQKAAETIFPQQTIDRFSFDIEILVIARAYGFKIKELPVVFDNPAGSTVRLSAYVESFIDLVQIGFKRILGAYSPSYPVRFSLKNYNPKMRSTFVFLAWSCVAFVMSFFIYFGPQTFVDAKSIDTPLSQVIFQISSGLSDKTTIDSPSSVYRKIPITKEDTAVLLIMSFLCFLFGADLISGLVLPRFASRLSRVLSAPNPFRAPQLGHAMQNMQAYKVH